MAFFHLSLGIKVDEILCHNCNRRLSFGLGCLPLAAGKLVDFRCSTVGAYIFLNDIHLLHGNIEHIVSCIFDFDIVFFFAFYGKLLDSYETAYTVVFVHHIIALAHVGKGLDFLTRILELFLFAARLSACEYVAFAYPAKLLCRKIYACSKASLFKENFALKADSLRELLKV